MFFGDIVAEKHTYSLPLEGGGAAPAVMEGVGIKSMRIIMREERDSPSGNSL